MTALDKPMIYKPSIIMDSGAYSAWQRRATLDVAAYSNFLFENLDWIEHYIALDVIKPEDPVEAAQLGYANFRYMKARGLDPWPVLHQGEDISWLHRYLDEGCRHIGLAATSLRSQPEAAYKWYELAWAHLVNQSGEPLVQVHMFGDARPRSLFSFPWASSDTTSWRIQAQVFTAFMVRDIMLSTRHDHGPGHGTRDIGTLSELEREALVELLDENGMRRDIFDRHPDRQGHSATYDREHGMQCACARSILMIKWFQQLEAQVALLAPQRFAFRPGFVNGREPPDAPADPDYQTYQMYLVVSSNATQAFPIMRAAEQERILLSYYYVRNDTHDLYWQRFARDPEITNNDPKMRRYTVAIESLYERNRPHESPGTVPPAEPVRPTYRRPSA
jgi:hypothetical protein